MSLYKYAYPVSEEVGVGFFAPPANMPASALGYHSNNRYDGFPPLMNDGRSVMASARSEPLTHNKILQNAGFTCNASYREYMIKNAREIVTKDFTDASTDAGYPVGGRFADQIMEQQGGPILYRTVFDTPQTPVSDLKSIYLSREQLDAKRVAPRIFMQ